MLSHQYFLYLVTALAAYGLGDYPTAHYYYRETRKQKMGPMFEYYFAISLSGLLLAQAGKKERAVEFLSLAKSLPFVAAIWHSTWALPNRVLAQLQAELPLDVYAAAWERGKALPIEVAASVLLGESV